MKLSSRESINQIRTFSRTFIERPRFAMVIAIVLTLAGLMAIRSLPVSQYPQLTPPSISVSYTYPGANAREVLNTVAMPIEGISRFACSYTHCAIGCVCVLFSTSIIRLRCFEYLTQFPLSDNDYHYNNLLHPFCQAESRK